MGKKSWFSSVKKALSPKKGSKSSKKGVDREGTSSLFTNSTALNQNVTVPEPETVPVPVPVPVEDVKVTEVEDEETKHAYSVAVATAAAATAAAAEAAVAAAHAAAEVVRLTSVTPFAGKSLEEVAAIRIQTAFRGYQARRALRALRGLVRLKTLVDGPTAKRQTGNALKCMQALSRVQSQINSRRLRMSEENRALQKQLLQTRAKELETLRMGEEWDQSLQSKEQIESNLLQKYEAAMRRERALAYSYSHQQSWKKSMRSSNLLFMDPTNPQWGWSWLERWMAARPWEQGIGEKELNGDKNANLITVAGEITKSFARHQLNSDNPLSPVTQVPNRHSPSTPTSKPISSAGSKKLRSASPRVQDDDSRSIFSVQSERNRRHSIAGGSSSIRDDESLSSCASVPSYMAPTKSAKAKTRLQSPLGLENGTPEKAPVVSAKKRLSYPPSPARPRQSAGPPRVSSFPITNKMEGEIKE